VRIEGAAPRRSIVIENRAGPSIGRAHACAPGTL